MAQEEITNGVLGGLSVAEQTQDYFLIFKGILSTTPEIINNSAYFIEYIVDSDGNYTKPSTNTVAQFNSLQNFSSGKSTIVRLDNATNENSQLGGEHNIVGVGSLKPILYSQYGIPSSSYTSSIKWVNPAKSITVPNILGSMQLTTDISGGQPNNIYPFQTIVTTPGEGANFNLTDGTYHITASAITEITQVKGTVSYYLRNFNRDSHEGLIKIRNYNGSTYKTYTQQSYSILGNSATQGSFNFTIQSAQLQNNITLSVQVTNPDTTIDLFNLSITETTPSPTQTTNGNYFDTGSDSNITWLTASAYLSLNYGKTQDTSDFNEALSFGFSPIQTPFSLQPGDKIRFEYNPDKEYYIYDIIPPGESPDGLLKIKLNSPIPAGTVLDNFIIYRIDTNDIKSIILDIQKSVVLDNPDNPFTGLILPKYPTEKLKKNLEKIIGKLKQEGIIQN